MAAIVGGDDVINIKCVCDICGEDMYNKTFIPGEVVPKFLEIFGHNLCAKCFDSAIDNFIIFVEQRKKDLINKKNR
jgi:hypothetical protein